MDFSKYMDDTNQEAEVDENVEAETAEQGESTSEKPTEETSLESKLDGFEDGKVDGNLLSLVESLGITRNGLPAEFKDDAHIKEILSKGFDYTHKTQELSELRKSFEDEMKSKNDEYEKKIGEFKQYESSVQEKLVQNDIILNVLGHLKNTDPTLFAELEQMYDSQMANYRTSINNPIVAAMQARIDQLEGKFGSLDGQTKEKKSAEINSQWENELKEVQSQWGTKLKSLGVKPDWKKVQQVWGSDSTSTMSVKAALLAAHGDEITKAMESKAKLLETKTKNAPKTPIQQASTKAPESGYMTRLLEIAKRHSS